MWSFDRYSLSYQRVDGMTLNLDRLRNERLVYLATPYTKYGPGTMRAFWDACDVTIDLASKGISVFSPIVHGHFLTGNINGLPNTQDFWWKFNLPFLQASSCMAVSMMPGWEHSDGIRAEIDWCVKNDKMIYYLRHGSA